MLAVMKKEKKPGAVITQTDPPSLGPTDLLIKVKATSICGTDVHIYNWDGWASSRVNPPLIFGHEFCGEVVETGSLVKDFSPGDFVSAESHIPCGHCYQCRNNQMHICQNLKILGVDTNGCFAQYAVIPEICAWKNPPDMSLEVASIQEPLGNAVYATLAEEITGKSIAVFGCGPSGLFSVGVAHASGAWPVISIIKHEFRRKIAEDMGATYIFQAGKEDIEMEIFKATQEQGVDVVLEMTGNPEAFQQAFRVVKKGGRITLFGIPSQPVSLDLAKEIIFKGVRVHGINGRKMYETWYRMRSLLKSGKLNPLPVITHRFPLSEFEKAMQTMVAKDRRCGKVVLFP
jgi:threonine 3-dehydrogenase